MNDKYKNFDAHLRELLNEVYDQPEDAGHTRMALDVINRWMANLPDCHSVLDVGCGTGFCQPMFERFGVNYEGVCLGNDYLVGQEAGHNVKRMDFNFLDYEEDSFDMVFSRHSIEHSFAPIISLMEWHRVARHWLGLIVPAPEHFGYIGRNHNYVLNKEQWENLLLKTGWRPIWKNETLDGEGKPIEYCIFCEKVQRVKFR